MVKMSVARLKNGAKGMAAVETAISNAIKFRRLNCLITETFDLARQQAGMALQRNLQPFPVVVKDCFTLKSVPTTCGSKMLADFKPAYTSTVVQKLLDAGGVVVGKSNQDEFSMGTSSSRSVFGPVKSPWTEWIGMSEKDGDPEEDWIIPGGSSGGGAVAVASGIARIALGSDTGGSTRNPAAFCGVVGLKPSYGLLSRHGLIPLTNSLDVPALMARDVQDIRWALEMTMGRDANDATSVDAGSSTKFDEAVSLEGMVVGIPKEYRTPELSVDCLDAWNKAACVLVDAGCTIKQVSLPHTEHSIVCYHILGECDVASNMARYDGVEYGYRAEEDRSTHDMYAASRNNGFNEVVRRRILAGNYFLLRQHYDSYFGQAMRVRRLIADDFYRLFRPLQFGMDADERVDVLLTPVTSSSAPWHSAFERDDGGYARERSDDYFTQPANMAGVPAISVPAGVCSRGLPLAVQVMADWMNDAAVLRVAAHIQHSLEFQLPSVS